MHTKCYVDLLKLTMNKIFYPLILLVSFLFSSCTSDQTTVQIIRSPLLKFDLSPVNSWKADGYSLSQPSQVVEYPQDTSLPAQFYDRYVLTGTGKAPTYCASASKYPPRFGRAIDWRANQLAREFRNAPSST